ncbi:hypothetical protein LguiA_027333 [Lonicera macranthoides]
MDLGCIDLGCIEKQRDETSLDSPNTAKESIKMTTSKVGKVMNQCKASGHAKRLINGRDLVSQHYFEMNKAAKETSQSSANILNKFTSQIKKPSHRKSSPLNWFPRRKVDSYLKRKIKLLQEVGGMNSTLDETLGDSNPHYSRVLREKIAVRVAAHKAMEARKAAMVEASWCRILRAARIENKEAEAQLLKAEQNATEAFEAAKAIGVIMYDIPDCPRKHYEIETSAINGGESTTHTVTASFETAFEVDKQVAAAVKSAFTRLANCPSISKEEFKELLQKISENPDIGENNQELSSGFSSDCESDTGSELVEMMLERLRRLQEDELASLATIVATCGLNAALAEESKQPGLGSDAIYTNMVEKLRTKHVEEELPSLDKFLVKRLTRLEREVQEAKNARKNGAREASEEKANKSHDEGSIEASDLGSILVKHSSKFEKEIEEAKKCSAEFLGKDHKLSSGDANLSEVVPDFGSMPTKHSSKLEKEIEEAKRKYGKLYKLSGKKPEREHDQAEVPSLDKFLVKHVSKLEREVQEAKIGRKTEPTNLISRGQMRKENIDLNKNGQTLLEAGEALSLREGNEEGKETESSLDKIMLKPIHWSEREKAQALSTECDYGIQLQEKKHGGNAVTDRESLDKVLVKHVSRLEKEKMGLDRKEEEVIKTKRRDVKAQLEKSEGSLDQILVKHVSRLEREKMAAAQQPKNQIKHLATRREERERELQEAWGGLSLGGEANTTRVDKSKGSLDQILVKHKSRLEKEKMAAAAQQADEPIKPLVGRREARERELQEAWGGLSLGNSVRPHVSRLQRDKASFLINFSEEEERNRAIEEV